MHSVHSNELMFAFLLLIHLLWVYVVGLQPMNLRWVNVFPPAHTFLSYISSTTETTNWCLCLLYLLLSPCLALVFWIIDPQKQYYSLIYWRQIICNVCMANLFMFLCALKQLEKNTFNLLLQAQERPTFLLSVECSYPSLSRTTSDAILYISVDYEQQPSSNNQFCVVYLCVPRQVISYSSHWCEPHFHAEENWLCFTFCSGPLWCCPWDEPLSIHTHATRKCWD